MIRPYTKENLEAWLKESYSLREVLIKSGRCPCGGGSYEVLKRKLVEFNIPSPLFKEKPFKKSNNKDGPKLKWSANDIFIADSPITQKVLREYVRRYNVIDYSCSFCGNTGEWRGKPLILQLDHINGDNKDNRIENLRYLCPNCHSTTDNYCGKNKKEQKSFGGLTK